MRGTRVVRRSASGFTLVEILIAFGIFAIGMIAVASLFPVAALLQRETASEVVGEHAANSARAIVEAKGLTYSPPASSGANPTGDLGNYYSLAGRTDKRVVPLYALNPNLLRNRFTVFDRSYPSASITAADGITHCDLHWVPFIQDISGNRNSPNWVMRLFILESDSRATYTQGTGDANPTDIDQFPKVVSVGCSVVDQTTFQLNGAHDLEGGDKIMDSNGSDYTIAEVNGNRIVVIGRILLSPEQPGLIWYAPKFGGPSNPTQRIVTVKFTAAPAP